MSEENMVEPILKVEDLKVHFHAGGGLFSKKKVVKAVDGVSFEIMQVKRSVWSGKAAVVKVRPEGLS